MVVISVFISLLLDYIFVEPRRFHPLVGFGNIAQQLECLFNREKYANWIRAIFGGISLIVLILPLVILCYYLQPTAGKWAVVFDALILFWAIGAHSLEMHAKAVVAKLKDGNICAARVQVAKIVSRQTGEMQCQQAIDATVESVLENGSDAIFAPLFWYFVGGAPAVVAYRLSNTLDAMWGYKTNRFFHFGWVAARLDDLLNWLPARLTSMTYLLLSSGMVNIRVLLNQANAWDSPNAGPVLSAGAWALGISLGGDAKYDGKLMQRIKLGTSRPATIADVGRASMLIRQGIIVWLLVALLGVQIV